jgi:excisionase family DNA binding protein
MFVTDRPDTHDGNRFLTPADVAKILGVTQTTVLGWIHAGELRAVNSAQKAGPGRRPRWKISPADLATFEASRATTQAVGQAPGPAPAATAAPTKKRTLRTTTEYVQ